MNLSILRAVKAAILVTAAIGVLSSVGYTQTTKKPKVALVMKSLANEFFQTMEKGARDYQAQHSSEFDLISNGIKNETDVSAQIDLVDQMIAQKVDAIIIAPADSKALIPVCRKAQQAGIVVVNIDNKFDTKTLEQEKVTFPFVEVGAEIGR